MNNGCGLKFSQIVLVNYWRTFYESYFQRAIVEKFANIFVSRDIWWVVKVTHHVIGVKDYGFNSQVATLRSILDCLGRCHFLILVLK